MSEDHIRAIVTHPFPDLDALLCIYLLRRYGARDFPGCDTCELRFMSPMAVEEAGGPEALEEQGLLVVDLGGGRFDNHPRRDRPGSGNLDAAAAELLAEHLGVRNLPELRKVLAFGSRQDLKGQSIRSRDPIDHAVALPAIINGFNQLHPGQGERVYHDAEPVFDAIVAVERAWFQALDDADDAIRSEVGDATVLTMESSSSAAARAGRYNGADLLLVRYLPEGFVACTMRREGCLKAMRLDGLASRFRQAEVDARGLTMDGGAGDVGMVGGWFLHQSYRILNKGSHKAPDVEPTVIDKAALHELAVQEVKTYLNRAGWK